MADKNELFRFTYFNDHNEKNYAIQNNYARGSMFCDLQSQKNKTLGPIKIVSI